ncbi:chymotrypsin BII [Amyelois transitella]|uniref:chymotrypsin BII n=1 Tax=Amyelois transitella TaxID=680683 RepID=UPI00298FC637|nr:chymotrypsin BII [Amyelois transitella]
MKAFALILLFIVAAVQARSTGFKNAQLAPLSGSAPSLVHLRLAVSTSGLLRTCAGSIIDSRWLLTSASCVAPARFIWSRYGAVDVIRPELVLETSSVDVNVRIHPNYNAATGANNIALISLNRNVEFTSSIVAPVLASEGAEIPSSGSFCAYGQNENNGPGEQLRCVSVEVQSDDNGAIVASSADGQPTDFDVGAPLIVDGVQYGILVDPASGTFLNPAGYRDWIESTAGITLPTGEDDSSSEEDSSDEDSSEEVDAVRFVN